MTDVPDQTNRTRLCFTLRAVVLVVFCACLLLGWLSKRLTERRARQAVIEMVESIGGKAYECSYPDVSQSKSLILRGFDCRPLFVDLTATSVCDTDLSRLNGTWVRELRLGGVSITDIGLKKFSKTKGLESLVLRGTSISDAGIGFLQVHSCLTELSLSDTLIGDNGLKQLSGLFEIRRLCLRHTCVTDNGLKHLTKLSKLDWLMLSETHVSDAGLATLAALPDLWALGLHRTKVTDAGLWPLAKLKNLTYLDLRETNVTDRGLTCLQSLSNLKWLRLTGTNVTSKGVRDFVNSQRNGNVDIELFTSFDRCLERRTAGE